MKGNVFIKRPVLAMSISILIVIVGLISLFTLPVEQYPDIAPPTVMVSTAYTGADAEAVQKSVIMPLEENINGVENMIYMSSTATNSGSASISVYFKQGTDPVVHGYEQRFGLDLGLLQAGDGPGHGGGERAEPCGACPRVAPGRSDTRRCEHAETTNELPAD